MCWRPWIQVPLSRLSSRLGGKETFQLDLLQVGQSLSLRLPILMTLEGLFVHLMHFDH